MQNYFAGIVDETVSKQGFVMTTCNHLLLKKQRKGEDDVSVETLIEESDVVDPLKPFSGSSVPERETLNNKDMVGMIEELRLCLPLWVTRDQMLHLLTRSAGDIVEATSEFYEHETEFYEQVPMSDTKINTVKTTPKIDCVVPPNSPVRDTSVQSLINIPSLDNKLPSLTHSSKGTVSFKKRGSVPDKKSKKKVKTNSATDSKQAAITKFFKKQDSALASSGSLQTAITKFFKKAVPDDSQASKDSSATEPYKNI